MDSKSARILVRLLALLVSFTLVAAACGDDDGDGNDTAAGDGDGDGNDTAAGDDDADSTGNDSDDEDTGDDPDDGEGSEGDGTGDDSDDADDPGEERSASWRGVTEDTITVGISMLDFDLLKELGLSPAGWGDQQAVWEALIADLNANGGINGRNVEAVYDFYSAISGEDADRSCTTLTQDQEVFAVLGGFVGPLAGTADPCIVGLNETFLVGGEQTTDELAQANAPWYHPAPTDEANTGALLDLLIETGRADGAKVFVMGGAAAEAQRDIVLAELEARNIEVVGDDIIDAADGDTFAQDAELEVIMQRVQELGATAIFVFGTPSASIRGIGNAGLDGQIDVWANDPAGLSNLGATITDKSIADGVLTVTGPTDTEIYDDPLYQSQCHEVVAAAVPDADLRTPTAYAEDEENWFNPIRRYCRHLALFVTITEAAGVNPTYETVVEGANSLTDFVLPGSAKNSLGPDKLTAEDLVRLSAYDSTEGDGVPVPVTELIDIFP